MRIRNYREILTPEERESAPRSFDVIGDICIIKLYGIDAERTERAGRIGEAILKAYKNIKTVFLDMGVKEEYRLRDLEFICGERKSETIHKEYGARFRLNVEKVYFSPRLASEHYRVAREMKKGDIVIDMFSGIGGFPILGSRYGEAKRIYAIDINPDAIYYLKENIRLNHAENIIPILGDAREEMKRLPEAQRTIMNLPHSASEFLRGAIEKTTVKIYYYELLQKDEIEKRIAEIKDMESVKGVEYRMVKPYAKLAEIVCMEIKLY